MSVSIHIDGADVQVSCDGVFIEYVSYIGVSYYKGSTPTVSISLSGAPSSAEQTSEYVQRRVAKYTSILRGNPAVSVLNGAE